MRAAVGLVEQVGCLLNPVRDNRRQVNCNELPGVNRDMLTALVGMVLVYLLCTLVKIASFSSTTMCQYWDNHLIY